MKLMQRAPQQLCARADVSARAAMCKRQNRASVVARCEAEAVGVEKQGQNFTAAKDIDAIMKALPHRWGFVLE